MVPKKLWAYIKRMRKDFVGIPPLHNHDGHLSSSSAWKADILSDQYQSVFTHEDLNNIPAVPQCPYHTMSQIEVSARGVRHLLLGLKTGKAHGLDCIPAKILKASAEYIAPCLLRLFQQSIDAGEVPDDWRMASISAVFKKGDKSDPSNYRPVSLTSVCCKILEHIIYSNITDHLDENRSTVHYQHGFRSKHPCDKQLIGAMEDIYRSMDHGHQTDLLILYFSKAFDTVPHTRLCNKLYYYGIHESVIHWIRNWLKDRRQRVVVDGVASKEVVVESGVPQGTVLGPLLFLLYINDMGDGVRSNIRLFADDCILYRRTMAPTDAEALQSDLDTLADWAHRWQMHFNVSKC